MEACFEAHFPQEGVRQGEPNPQEFVSKAIQELQESRVMKGSRRLPAVAPHPGEDGGLRVCIDIPGLNRVASLERLWPSRVGRCEGPPHSYVCMPYGLLNATDTYRRLMRGITEAQEARCSAALGAREDRLPQPTESATPTLLRPQHHQVTSFEFYFQLGAPPGLHYSQAAWVRPCSVYHFFIPCC